MRGRELELESQSQKMRVWRDEQRRCYASKKDDFLEGAFLSPSVRRYARRPLSKKTRRRHCIISGSSSCEMSELSGDDYQHNFLTHTLYILILDIRRILCMFYVCTFFLVLFALNKFFFCFMLQTFSIIQNKLKLKECIFQEI